MHEIFRANIEDNITIHLFLKYIIELICCTKIVKETIISQKIYSQRNNVLEL